MKIVNTRILAVANAFDELHALVTSEPELAEFTPATTELQAIAQRVRTGQPVGLTVSPDAAARIPSRALAERILVIVNRAPGPIGTEDVETRHTFKVLHANLVRAVVHAIFVDYPDLMRG